MSEITVSCFTRSTAVDRIPDPRTATVQSPSRGRFPTCTHRAGTSDCQPWRLPSESIGRLDGERLHATRRRMRKSVWQTARHFDPRLPHDASNRLIRWRIRMRSYETGRSSGLYCAVCAQEMLR
jgi:hypothetical protein